MLSTALLKQARSPLFIIPATALLVLLLISGVFQRQQQSLVDTRTDHYGEALAALAARQAMDATLNHDLISLQVTLSDIVENPHVLLATIHDVESKLLVQAGESPDTGHYRTEDSVKYSAPITLHDSVAGYVTVLIDERAIYQQQNNSWLLGLIAVMATLAGLSLLNPRKIADNQQSNTEVIATAPKRSPQDPAKPSFAITLELQCLNIDSIRKQLNGSMRKQLFDDLERRISAINTLYNGRIANANNSGITLTFNDSDIANGCFRAICCSQLLFRLLDVSEQAIKPEYSAAIFKLADSKRLADQMQQAKFIEQCRDQLQQSPPKSLTLHSDSCASSHLLQRLDADGNSPWQNISGLQPSYSNLIDKQVAQLLQLLDS